ncbi:hypothetical protein OHA72_23005 [Dactylosporangium sp. NBC_01737]|uniref:hypothetical protein n=1 Tax=Dactylosporangium sp. NBC_01737 TaxID=2975959 RepID=UPI002E1678F1|nr:hypothetical protein OHA72_23005 [Dactylosporangium sp. NBC_01737]
MSVRRFWAAVLLLAASIGVLRFAATQSELERCSAGGVGPLPWLAVAGMVAACVTAFSAAREAYGWWAAPAGLLFGAAAIGLLCSGWLVTFGQGAFSSGCV